MAVLPRKCRVDAHYEGSLSQQPNSNRRPRILPTSHAMAMQRYCDAFRRHLKLRCALTVYPYILYMDAMLEPNSIFPDMDMYAHTIPLRTYVLTSTHTRLSACGSESHSQPRDHQQKQLRRLDAHCVFTNLTPQCNASRFPTYQRTKLEARLTNCRSILSALSAFRARFSRRYLENKLKLAPSKGNTAFPQTSTSRHRLEC
jgi:hypothetical protein